MNGFSCHVRNLRPDSLSGFRSEKDACSAGGCYLQPDAFGWIDATGREGLCIVCENCGSVIENAPGAGELYCPDCGESTFRVFQTFRLVSIKVGFVARWHVPGLMVAIDVPASATTGMMEIHYTTDGSDPTLTSPVYTGAIPYHKEHAPIRAAVYYPNARSQIIEWDYGRAETNRKRIKKQCGNNSTSESHKVKLEPIPHLPETTRVPATPTAHSAASKDDDKGCGCILVLAMGIGGVALISNGWPIIGWILTIVAALMVIGMCQGKER